MVVFVSQQLKNKVKTVDSYLGNEFLFSPKV